MVRLLVGGALLVFATAVPQVRQQTAGRPKQLIAHRGASGYAPEHTIASYQLALDQKADFVEPDLAISKDWVLICLHDRRCTPSAASTWSGFSSHQ